MGESSYEKPLEESIRWLVDAVVDDDLAPTVDFFTLSSAAQLLSLHLLRTIAKAIMDLAPLDPIDLLAGYGKVVRESFGVN